MSGLEVARADMESAGTAAPIATSGKHEAAGEVSASSGVGVTRLAMMSDQSLGKSWVGSSKVQAGMVKAVRCSFLLKRAAP